LPAEVPERDCEFQERRNGRVACGICPHGCVIAEGKTGVCLCRKNVGGRLRPMNYARVTSAGMDPIEKKPLYHFHPGKDILSLGTWGCNFKCDFCQNWQISQQEVPTDYLPPAEAVALARRRGSAGIAYTYNEPTIWYEYVLDTGRLAREAGLVNVLVTNGYINPDPLDRLLEVVDAMNIDLKAFADDFYQRRAKGHLAPVLAAARRAAARCHVETTTLLIPGENDSPEELAELRDWIAENLGPDSPTHLSAYSPRYKLGAPATPIESLMRACEVMGEKLRFVYIGNVLAPGVGNTRCPECGAVAVRRSGYRVDTGGLRGGACAACGRDLNFVGN
jgi:pyruvate formate lyase activating enzyme